MNELAIVGIRLTESDFKKTHKERGCEHDNPEGSFCPECGKPTWVDKRESLDDVAISLGEDVIRPFGSKGKKVILGKIIGVAGDGSTTTRVCETFDFEDIKMRLQEVLEPLEMWNEKQFSLRVVADKNSDISRKKPKDPPYDFDADDDYEDDDREY